MGPIARCLLGALLVGVVAAALSACGGGGSTDPGTAVEAASEHLEQVKGESLLAEVELEQAFLEEDEKEAVDKPRQMAKSIARVLHAVHRIEHECWEGNGLESCTEIEPIEDLVAEIEKEARFGPDR